MENYNVLLIMTDQQRWDTLGCYGNSVIETPNLDYLASEGTVFTNAYTPSPSCVPARASLITGMDPWNTGILGMGARQGPIGVGFKHTLPGELAKEGYHTQGVGKMHFYPQRSLNGFHHTVLDESGRVQDKNFVSDYRKWFEDNKTGDYEFDEHGIGWNSWMARPYHAPEFLHPTNWTINESIRFLDEKDPSKPFFLKTSFARPHSPYDAIPYFFDLYLDKDLPKPAIGDWASMHDKQEDAMKTDAWRGKRTDEEIHRARAGYYGSINHIDHQIGRLIKKLKEIKEFHRTIIIFTSDHGDMLGDHNLWRKTYGYEGSAHIPLFVWTPESMGNFVSRVDEPVLLQDIMPTILEMTGVTIPETVDGKSMVGLMKGESNDWRSYLHGEHIRCYSPEQEMHYLTDGKYKYIWLPVLNIEQLFDLENDPYECVDLANNEEYLSELEIWRERLITKLEPRDAGLTDGKRLISQQDKPAVVSPHYQARLEESPFDWMK